ncbi:ABC transporter permease [Agilicoccus flavus]|uniref:ABC transporter permease n=1 Tax=Agilicoccus flavus TaxID=2775968 RepID=UPI001CF65343|nr:ABC transporter permease subunit [Agilicoccus flavus]
MSGDATATSTSTSASTGRRRRRPLSWRAELGRQVRRRRTLWAFGIVVALPLILVGAFALGDDDGSGTGFSDLARHGAANLTVFTLLISSDFLLVILAALFAGDAVPAEASWSSLRYLLVAPVGRARLLTSKLVVALAGVVAATTLLAAWSLLVGGVAYGWEPYTSPGGTGLDWAAFLPRLGLAVAAICVTLLQVAGIALLLGTLGDAPLGAVGGAVLVTILASILDAIPELGDLRHALPMHYSRSWLAAFSPDIAWTDLQRGALWSLVYFVASVAGAYWWFRRKDVLS